jgi:hypothetical protein
LLGAPVSMALAPLPSPPKPSLPDLAVESLLDGCLNEGCAAREAELRLETTTLDPEVADVLAMIARDERRHAELGWAIVEWALAVEPEAVTAALHTVQLPSPRDGFAFPRRCDRARLRAFGWIEPDLCAAAHADVVRDLEARLAARTACHSGT